MTKSQNESAGSGTTGFSCCVKPSDFRKKLKGNPRHWLVRSPRNTWALPWPTKGNELQKWRNLGFDVWDIPEDHYMRWTSNPFIHNDQHEAEEPEEK